MPRPAVVISLARVAAVGLAGVVAGCSQSATTDFNLDPRADRLGDEDTLALQLAEDTLVARCMKRKGFEFEVVAQSTEAVTSDQPYGRDDVAQARRNGYGPVAPAEEPLTDPNGPYVRSLSAQGKRDFQAAFMGPPGARRAEVSLPQGISASFPLEGCVAEGPRKLFGDLKRYMTLMGFVDNLEAEVQNRVITDGEFTEARSRWRNCMQKRGFSYPETAVAAQEATKLPRAEEFEVAVADATCGRSAGINTTGRRLERRYRAEVYHEFEGRIIGFRELQRAAIPKAKRILRGS